MALAWGPTRKTFTVAELSTRIRDLLGSEFDDVWVAGEISGSKMAASGHCYFTLKDQEAQVRCVCFRTSLRYLKFKPQDGVAVLARGRIDVYEARGEYQLLVEALEPQGHGALQFAFEQLKKKLAAEGLFEAAAQARDPAAAPEDRNRNFTHRRGDRRHDADSFAPVSRACTSGFIRRWCRARDPSKRWCAASNTSADPKWPDVVIVARGGGSLEDLWTFNEEAVARAIAASKRAGDLSGGPRNGLHHRRFRGGSARAHALGRRGTGDLHAGTAHRTNRPCGT